MKTIVCVTALSSMLMHGADSRKALFEKPVADSQPNLCIHETPATVFDSMMSKGIIAIQNLQPDALKSSIGKTYMFINRMEGVKDLCSLEAVAAQALIYKTNIHADRYVQVSANLVNSLAAVEDTSILYRISALTALGTIYHMLQNKLIANDIPGFQLHLTVEDTIRENDRVLLDHKVIFFYAAQLSLALNLQEQYTLDPVAFETLFKEYIPNKAPVISTGWLGSWFGSSVS